MKQHLFSHIIVFFAAATSVCLAQEKVTLDFVQQPAHEIFHSIALQSGYAVYYNPSETDSLLLTIQCVGYTPETALKQALEGTPFQVAIFEDKYLFILKDKPLNTQLPEDYFTVRSRPAEITAGLPVSPLEQKAISENKVYTVGDEKTQNLSERVRLTGVMTDFRTGEPVIGATINLENTTIGTTTDAIGFYSLQLPTGRHRLMIRGVGLKETQRQVMLYSDGKLDIELEEQIFSLQEVVVTAGRMTNIQSINIGMELLKVSDIKNIPTIFGETDVIRVVMMLPGVKAVGEASSGFNVRGGATEQNLILFNNGTVYNPTHLFGFFSVFNPDLIKDMELYKSSIPAKYGGRISSVLDINGREGNKEEFDGQISLGLLTSRMTLEGPIGKKTSFILGGRTTYSDWLLRMLPEESGYKDGTAGFYDLNAIIDHKFSDSDNLSLSGYYSHDRFQFTTDDRYGYTNMNMSAKWRHFFSNQRLTSTFIVGYDHYDYTNSMTDNPFAAYSLAFAIDQKFARLDFIAYANDKHTIDFGLGSILYDLNPGEYLPVGPESLVIPDKLQKEKALESSVYLSDRWDITPVFSMDAGIRYSLYNAIGPRTYNVYDPAYLPHETTVLGTKETKSGSIIKTWQNPELRLSARYIVNNTLSFKAGVTTLSQYIHKLSNTTIMSPTDTWKLSDAHITPQKGMQAAAGVYKNFNNGMIETSVELYYKTMKDYLDYRSGALLSMNHHIETDVISTEGRAYGAELMLKKTQGKLNGWISYSYARTELRQHDPRVEKPVNNGNWYPASYDKPHDLKLAGNYKFTQRYSVSLNCEYSTGRPITLPTSKYKYGDGEYIFYTERNKYRVPDFFRMDFSINIEPSHNLTLLTHSSITFGVYNLTGRKNIYSVYYTSENGMVTGYQMAIFGAPVPYVSYNIKF